MTVYLWLVILFPHDEREITDAKCHETLGLIPKDFRRLVNESTVVWGVTLFTFHFYFILFCFLPYRLC